jgi:hypothetical protein
MGGASFSWLFSRPRGSVEWGIVQSDCVKFDRLTLCCKRGTGVSLS